MIRRLSAQLAEQLGESIDADDRRELERDVREDSRVRIAINLCWLPVTAETLLAGPLLEAAPARERDPHA